MTDEQKAAYVMAQAACLMAEVAGMQAENMQRTHRGESVAYPESAFVDAVNRSACHPNSVLSIFHG